MVRIVLPGRLDLTCPKCRAGFSVELAQVQGRGELACPFCSENFRLYDGLTGQNRKRVYHAIRDELERQVYDRQVRDGKINF